MKSVIWYAQKTIENGWSRNTLEIMVEYTFQESRRPMGVATYMTKLVESLPKDLKSNLPTIEQGEAELAKDQNNRSVNKKKLRIKIEVDLSSIHFFNLYSRGYANIKSRLSRRT